MQSPRISHKRTCKTGVFLNPRLSVSSGQIHSKRPDITRMSCSEDTNYPRNFRTIEESRILDSGFLSRFSYSDSYDLYCDLLFYETKYSNTTFVGAISMVDDSSFSSGHSSVFNMSGCGRLYFRSRYKPPNV